MTQIDTPSHIVVKENPFEELSFELEKLDHEGVRYFKSLPPSVQERVMHLLLEHKEDAFQTLNERLYRDEFYMTPPTIKEFLEDPYFFGKLASGMFPKWKENLIEKVFHPTKNYHEIILTGAIGGGKSYFMRVVHAYLTTKLLCLKNPNKIFGISDGDNIVIGFFNITLKKARIDQFNQFEQLLLRSPFLAERLNRRHKDFFRVNPERPFKDSTLMYALGSSAVHALGQNTISGQLDEANFSARRRLNMGEIERSLETYQSVKSRISSRFEAKMRIFYHYFIMMIASSKTFGNSFVQAHIDKVKNNSDVLIFDYAEWDVKPPETYEMDEHGRVKTFKILVGNKKVRSCILDDDTTIPVPEGCRVIEAPLSLKQYAEYDLDEFLRSRAGIATEQDRKFIPRDDLIIKAFDKQAHRNGFISDSVECALGNTTPLSAYLDLSVLVERNAEGYFPIVNPYAPRHIHVDLSKNHDYTGFAMAHVAGFKTCALTGKERLPILYIDLLCRFEYKNSEIDYERIRALIYYLNDVLKFNIKAQGKISFDQFQSTDSIQLLTKQGYAAERIKVDADAHHALKSAILGEYIEGVKSPIAVKELINLERHPDNTIGKPLFNSDGSTGTDDVADALAGVCFTLLRDYAAHHETFEHYPRIRQTIDDYFFTVDIQREARRMIEQRVASILQSDYQTN